MLGSVLDYISKTNLFNFIIFLSILIFLFKKIDVVGMLENMKNAVIENIEAFSERNISYQQHSVFSLESLIMLLNNWANNQNLSIELLNHGSYFVKPFSHSQMERMIKANIIDAKIINGFDRLIKYMPNFGSEIFVNFRIKKNQYMGK